MTEQPGSGPEEAPGAEAEPAGPAATEPQVEAAEPAATAQAAEPAEPAEAEPPDPAAAAEDGAAATGAAPAAAAPPVPLRPAAVRGPAAGARPADQGRVFLVGAGPGDPGLLTVRGRALLEQADVVVYDRLVEPALLDACRPGCERIFVGKAPGSQALSQPEINRTLIERAGRGLQVVRLKGGDPFVFGRGGEEAQALHLTGLPFEVVPGVSSAVAVPAYAGIPLTHRDVASSFAVVTGHERADRDEPGVDWAAYGRQPDTLVVLMGRAELGAIAGRLIAAGRPASTPAALVAQGTLPRQRTVVTDLARIAAAADAAGLQSPAVLVVGEVVRLRRDLAWFERRPLFGRRVVVTRTREQSSELAATLRLLGAEPAELPVLRVRERPNRPDLEWCVTNIASFWWLCFTSAHAVRPFFETLRECRLDARTLAGTRVACVGRATAAAVAAHGLTADVVPERATVTDLVEALRPQVHAGQKALYVRGDPAGDALVSGLTALGLQVRQLVAYLAEPDPDAAGRAAALLADGADAVTFASSATVGHFLEATGAAGRELCAAARVVCIGPVTAAAAEALGLRVDAVAAEATVSGLLACLLDLWPSAAPGAAAEGA